MLKPAKAGVWRECSCCGDRKAWKEEVVELNDVARSVINKESSVEFAPVFDLYGEDDLYGKQLPDGTTDGATAGLVGTVAASARVPSPNPRVAATVAWPPPWNDDAGTSASCEEPAASIDVVGAVDATVGVTPCIAASTTVSGGAAVA